MRESGQKRSRRRLRLGGYDYTQPGAYFVTICIKGRERLLGDISERKLEPSLYGQVVEQCWTTPARHFQNIELDSYAIVPNHLLSVIVITGRGDAFSSQSQQGRNKSSENALPLQSIHGTQHGSLTSMVQSFESISTRKINRIRLAPGMPPWQRNYYEDVIRNEEEPSRIRTYIVNNPQQWELDRENPYTQQNPKQIETWQV